MSVKGKLARFLAETIVGNALAKAGEHIGDAVGNVVGRMIDPNHGKIDKADDKSKDEETKK